MAYVEVWKSGRLITRRRVDEQKARKGCRVRLGSAGEVRVAIGQSETLGELEVRMFAGEPPPAWQEGKKTVSRPPQDDQSLPPLSVVAPDLRTGQMDRYPDIEGYKIIEPLGEGGMGIVWRAEQLSTRRQVALKLMVSHRIESPKAQARFQREVELTARLDHPNIARIYDSGLHQGMYYYAMELVDGVPLDRYVKSKALSQDQILALMRTVCQALLFAHLRAVIHRDLKPSNILVSADGQPHVLDFGLAKALLEEDKALTISVEGQIAGTPAYMSPEQAAGHHSQTDTRTDVYSLGVIIYELLTGQSPFDLSGSMFDLLQQITEGKIRRPREITKSIDIELEAILFKALALKPDDRYASGGALAKDISNYLDGEPLDAQVPTILYFFRKKARKYRLQVGVAVALLAVLIFAYTKAIEHRTELKTAEKELQIQARKTGLTETKLEWVDLELKVLGKKEEDARAALRVLRDRYISTQEKVGDLQHKLGEVKLPVQVRRIGLDHGEPLSPAALVRQPSVPQDVQFWTLETCGHRGRIVEVVYSPDGNRLASAGHDGTVRIWNVKSGELAEILVVPSGGIVDLVWSVDSKHLKGTSSTDGIQLYVWNLESGEVQMVSETPTADEAWHSVRRVSWSADGEMLARMIDEVIDLWEVELPERWPSLARDTTALTLSPDGSTLAFGRHDGAIHFLDVKSGQLRSGYIPFWCGPVHSVTFSPLGNVLATCAGSGTVCLWDAHRWEPRHKFEADTITSDVRLRVNALAWAPDAATIARVNDHHKTIEILYTQSGQVQQVLQLGSKRAMSVAWAPDGSLLAAGTAEGAVMIWHIEPEPNGAPTELAIHSDAVNAVSWTPNSRTLITASSDGTIQLWDTKDDRLLRAFRAHREGVTCLAISPDGKRLASGGRDSMVQLWAIDSRGLSASSSGELNGGIGRLPVAALVWSPDGDMLVSGDDGGNVQIWGPDSREPIHRFKANCGSINSLAWSPDGRLLVCGGSDGTARVWDAKNEFRNYVVLLPLWGSGRVGVAISPAGDYRGTEGIEKYLRYVVQSDDGQRTLTSAEYRSYFGWVNEPWQVGLHVPGSEKITRIYVNAAAQGPYDGKSWATAFDDLQNALSVAQPNTEIWVAAGTYRPDRGTGARRASFYLKNGVRLLGGFVGTETSSHERDPNKYETILSGDLNSDDVEIARSETLLEEPTRGENSYHVVNASGTEPNALLDGFTITGGNANGPKEHNQRSGGGMYNSYGSPTILNCIFRYNWAMQRGGGFYNMSGKPTLTDCNFIGNSMSEDIGSYGGGMSNWYGDCTLTNCTFIGNSATACGGGMNNDSCKPTLKNCTFIDNSSKGAGGAMYNWRANCILIDCRFIGNSASDGGGMSNSPASPMLFNCTFVRNSAISGGGMHNGGPAEPGPSAPILANFRFLGNSATSGGGMFNTTGCSPILTNCVFGGNIANDSGGGMVNYHRYEDQNSDYIRYNNPMLINCIFSRNQADATCGGIYNGEDSRSTLTNCILWGNSDSGGTDESAQINNTRTDQKSVVNRCYIQGWSGKLGGVGNFGADPLFIDPDGPDNKIGTEDDNLRLKPGSPCINAGDNSAVPADTLDLDGDGDHNEPIPFDFEGKPRIINGAVDIGAFESG